MLWATESRGYVDRHSEKIAHDLKLANEVSTDLRFTATSALEFSVTKILSDLAVQRKTLDRSRYILGGILNQFFMVVATMGHNSGSFFGEDFRFE